jgi:uncharacterized protein YjiS (DUF1127 family)
MFNRFAQHQSIPPPGCGSPVAANRDITMTGAKRLKRLMTRWLRKRGQRRLLSELTDNELRDIGITRQEAAKEAAKPFWK